MQTNDHNEGGGMKGLYEEIDLESYFENSPDSGGAEKNSTFFVFML